MTQLVHETIDLNQLLAETDHPSCGGLAIFGGAVRDHHEGKSVTKLVYSAYEPLAKRLLAEVESETIKTFGVHSCRCVHRIGELAIGEISVYVVVRSAHRKDAFAACKHAIDRIKHEIPVWKHEFYTDGTSAYVKGCCLNDDDDDGHDHQHSH